MRSAVGRAGRGDRDDPARTLTQVIILCHPGEVFRLLALLGGLSVVTDLGTGSGSEESLKRCLVATRLARSLGCSDAEVSAVIYTSLLQHLGCTAYSHESAAIWGDDISSTHLAFLTDWTEPRDLLRTFVPGLAASTGRSRPRVLATALVAGKRIKANGPPATCEVAQNAARMLGLAEPVQEALYSGLTMWNGKGHPAIEGEQIPLSARIMHVASTAVMFAVHADTSTALTQVANRAGSYLDPRIAAELDPHLLDGIDDLDAYDAVLDAEPDPARLVDERELDDVARTFGDLADLKSPWLHGHSTAVGDLAGEAARLLRLDDVGTIRTAGYLHDIGRVAVSSRVWDKPGALTTSERDQVELHPYYTQRILSRILVLGDVARLASQHHERCDGSGYHRGLPASTMTLQSRVLAAADRYRCLVEDRPYRASVPESEAAARLEADARAGRLDGDAVSAVTQAAGHPRKVRRPRTAGLTDRQVDVLRLIAKGMSNREIAEQLVISTRTAEHHVQDVYLKIGVSTRAGAALFAMEHGLVEKSG